LTPIQKKVLASKMNCLEIFLLLASVGFGVVSSLAMRPALPTMKFKSIDREHSMIFGACQQSGRLPHADNGRLAFLPLSLELELWHN
jgi:hypothetical protein